MPVHIFSQIYIHKSSQEDVLSHNIPFIQQIDVPRHVTITFFVVSLVTSWLLKNVLKNFLKKLCKHFSGLVENNKNLTTLYKYSYIIVTYFFRILIKELDKENELTVPRKQHLIPLSWTPITPQTVHLKKHIFQFWYSSEEITKLLAMSELKYLQSCSRENVSQPTSRENWKIQSITIMNIFYQLSTKKSLDVMKDTVKFCKKHIWNTCRRQGTERHNEKQNKTKQNKIKNKQKKAKLNTNEHRQMQWHHGKYKIRTKLHRIKMEKHRKLWWIPPQKENPFNNVKQKPRQLSINHHN